MPGRRTWQRSAISLLAVPVRARLLLPVALGWLVCALVLGLHFHFYYAIEWRRALGWGLGDAFAWCLLAFALGLLYRRVLADSARLGLPLFLAVAVLAAVLLHPVAVTLLYWAIDGSLARAFHADVAHLAGKRLPQGIVAGLAIALGCVTWPRVASHRPEPVAVTEVGPASRPDFLWLKSAGSTTRVPIEDVLFVEAAGNYVSIVTGQRSFLERMTLAELARLLEPCGFRRISRRHLVNPAHLQSLVRRKPKGAVVTMRGGRSLPVSRAQVRELAASLTSSGPRST